MEIIFSDFGSVVKKLRIWKLSQHTVFQFGNVAQIQVTTETHNLRLLQYLVSKHRMSDAPHEAMILFKENHTGIHFFTLCGISECDCGRTQCYCEVPGGNFQLLKE